MYLLLSPVSVTDLLSSCDFLSHSEFLQMSQFTVRMALRTCKWVTLGQMDQTRERLIRGLGPPSVFLPGWPEIELYEASWTRGSDGFVGW